MNYYHKKIIIANNEHIYIVRNNNKEKIVVCPHNCKIDGIYCSSLCIKFGEPKRGDFNPETNHHETTINICDNDTLICDEIIDERGEK